MGRIRRPGFSRSIRFRLTVLYSTLLFALAATALGVTYVAVEQTTDPHPITRLHEAELVRLGSDGEKVRLGTMEVADVREIESEVTYRTLEALRNYSVAALGGLFLVSLGIGWVLSGRVLRPVRAIATTAADIQATDLSRRIRLGGPRDELGELGDTIDSMLDRLEHAFSAQRHLIGEASHELRSPLAIIRANLDASLTTQEASESERQRAIAVIDRATDRMSRLVEDLLATARRDADGMADTDVDLSVVAAEAGEDFAVLAAGAGLTVRYDLADGTNVIGDPDALRRAVGNLLSNAIRLSPAGASVSLSTGRVDGWCWSAVSDAGPGIGLADQEHIFDRFWRGPAGSEPEPVSGPGGRPRTARRTGLGLAIVRQITESHGGHVALYSTVGAGSTFVLWLPDPERPTAATPPAANPVP